MASRRAADELIAAGAVKVNGERASVGATIDPERDAVTVDGRPIRPRSAHRYVMLNKPMGVITTARDPSSRPTVLDAIGPEGQHGHRLFAVGRLDADTTGLLLLTDDGELAYRLTHPRYKVDKEYVAAVAGMPAPGDLQALRNGVKLDDGITAPAVVEMLRASAGEREAGHAELRIVIHEGRRRQVRRMLQAVGHRVRSLRRTAFGPLHLGRMKVGGWRVLTAGEVSALRRAAGLDRE